jgi:hypothetical protein
LGTPWGLLRILIVLEESLGTPGKLLRESLGTPWGLLRILIVLRLLIVLMTPGKLLGDSLDFLRTP